MAKPILDDRLWKIIEPLLPPPRKRRKRHPGRKPIDNRRALSAILFVLKTGLPWEYLPQELGWGSGMTAWRRLHAWQKKGVWQKVHEALLAHLHQADQIDWSRAIVDSSSVRAVHGGKKRDPIRQIAANPAANITWSPTPRAFRSRPR
jgi:transposase